MDNRMERDLAALREFHEKFQASSDPKLWETLVNEELAEVEQALADLLKELADLRYVMTGLFLTAPASECVKFYKTISNRMNRAIELVDQNLLDLTDEAFDRVHESNMSKLGDDGKPIRREDGKILKGPNYKPPVLIDLIRGDQS